MSVHEDALRDLAANHGWGFCDAVADEINDLEASYASLFKTHGELQSDLAAAQEWREAVLNELIVAHIYTKEHDTNPRKAIQDAITWNCQVALDPAVSSDAQKLIAAAQADLANVKAELDALKRVHDDIMQAVGECGSYKP